MNVFCGTDLVHIPRFKKILQKHGAVSKKNKFLLKLFAEEELEFLLGRKKGTALISSLAGRFAAKEAVVKAFAATARISAYNKIFITGDIPVLSLSEGAFVPFSGSETVMESSGYSSSVSISHDGDYACAVVLMVY